MTRNPSSIRLVVFDWAGTTVDFGSRAPAAAFKNVFAENGVDVSDAEARKPMGLNKREHLLAMLGEPEIAQRWQAATGSAWTEQDVDRMYQDFMPIQLKTIQDHADLIPGVATVADQLRDRGIKIGGSTGYFREAAELVAEAAAAAGYRPDVNLCADDVPQGRPAPWMIFRIMEQTGVYPASQVIKVGDTIADIQSGKAAGCLSLGVCDSSSVMGLSREQWDGLTKDERDENLRRVRQEFLNAGADGVLDSIEELSGWIEQHPAAMVGTSS